MRQWWRRIRGVVGMGLIWAVGGIGVGGLIELLASCRCGRDRGGAHRRRGPAVARPPRLIARRARRSGSRTGTRVAGRAGIASCARYQARTRAAVVVSASAGRDALAAESGGSDDHAPSGPSTAPGPRLPPGLLAVVALLAVAAARRRAVPDGCRPAAIWPVPSPRPRWPGRSARCCSGAIGQPRSARSATHAIRTAAVGGRCAIPCAWRPTPWSACSGCRDRAVVRRLAAGRPLAARDRHAVPADASDGARAGRAAGGAAARRVHLSRGRRDAGPRPGRLHGRPQPRPTRHGRAAYARAVDALRHWRMTTLGWASIHPPRATLAPGTVVAMVVHHFGFWSTHACRIVYAVDEVAGGDAGRGAPVRLRVRHPARARGVGRGALRGLVAAHGRQRLVRPARVLATAPPARPDRLSARAPAAATVRPRLEACDARCRRSASIPPRARRSS
jgi:hypothetical protein